MKKSLWKRLYYHYIKNKLHSTSWQDRMNSSRVTTPSLFLSIFCREQCKTCIYIFTYWHQMCISVFLFIHQHFHLLVKNSNSFNNCNLYVSRPVGDLEVTTLIQATWCLNCVLKCVHLTQLYWSYSKLLFAVFQVHTRPRLQDYESEKYDTDYNL